MIVADLLRYVHLYTFCKVIMTVPPLYVRKNLDVASRNGAATTTSSFFYNLK
jgi:hypothetical protein